ncbi:unnamed protein product [Linum trigynum]|uniref:Retrotransposon gag domain-containing protein n=1 Tax=Linum trigynum TaxID=586398 RepID=A0AAV2ERW2_9ROSI
MTRSNPSPRDEDINLTLRLLARERELAEARRRSKERGQQFGPGVSGVEVEEVKGEPNIGIEMAGNQREAGATQARNLNDAAAEEKAPRTMGYYMAPLPVDIQSPILHPPVAANNFEIKPALVTMIQNNALFHGHSTESPREHVQRFLELVGSLKINGMSAEASQLRLFPYSLSRKALRWLNNRPPRSITSWDDLLNNFMTRYCPTSKMAEWRKKITHFEQEEDETLRDAWERYSDYFL